MEREKETVAVAGAGIENEVSVAATIQVTDTTRTARVGPLVNASKAPTQGTALLPATTTKTIINRIVHDTMPLHPAVFLHRPGITQVPMT